MDSEIKEGTLRLLTLREIELARQVFAGRIIYPKVWIHCDSYLPAGLQRKYTAMAPNGEIYFRKELYRSDFSATEVGLNLKHIFIHEMAHVWQHQKKCGSELVVFLVGLRIIPMNSITIKC
ncbi:hypothetical protein [Winslowiella iniecta]|uniref:hypothetical protein n=1 Tax=Winslowiella iniecta TaxID=1560201 RepID=UPI000B334822